MRGDLVVGGKSPDEAVFSESGRKIADVTGAVAGTPQELASIQQRLTRISATAGGKALEITPQTKVTRAKTQKTVKRQAKAAIVSPFHEDIEAENEQIAKSSQQYREVAPQTPQKLTVQLENDFGKMKLRVVAVLEQELAFALVFENEEDMVFEPKVGEYLTFYDENRQKHTVYYPGVTFDWTNSQEKVMILFRVNE